MAQCAVSSSGFAGVTSRSNRNVTEAPGGSERGPENAVNTPPVTFAPYGLSVGSAAAPPHVRGTNGIT
jgi:hypothetical protein